jgi:RNA polymerase sigma-70 factor (ECF subfamily)
MLTSVPAFSIPSLPGLLEIAKERVLLEDQSHQPRGSWRKTPLSLLERARAPVRDEVAWDRLVKLYQPLVRFWCGRSGVPASDVDDLVQEVFAAVARGLAGFRRDRPGDTFRGWLKAVARNQVLLYVRRNRGRSYAEGGSEAHRRMQEASIEWDDPSEGEQVEIGQLYGQAIEQVRQGFEEPTWRAFWLSAVEGRPTAALVEDLGMSAAAIRQAKSRVLRRIKEELGELLS